MKTIFKLLKAMIIYLLVINQICSSFLQVHKGHNNYHKKGRNTSLKDMIVTPIRHKRQLESGRDSKSNITFVINGDINVINKINLSNCSVLFQPGPGHNNNINTTDTYETTTVLSHELATKTVADTRPSQSTCFTMVVVGYNISVIDSSSTECFSEKIYNDKKSKALGSFGEICSNGECRSVDDYVNSECNSDNSTKKFAKKAMKHNRTTKIIHPLCATCGGKNKTTPSPQDQEKRTSKSGYEAEEKQIEDILQYKSLSSFNNSKQISENCALVKNEKSKLYADKNKINKLHEEKNYIRNTKDYSKLKNQNEYFNYLKNDEVSRLSRNNEYNLDKGYHVYPRRLENVLGYYRSKEFLDENGAEDKNDLDDPDISVKDVQVNSEQNFSTPNEGRLKNKNI